MATIHSRPLPLRHVKLDEHLPVDHRLSQVYRLTAGIMGLFLLTFGILGLVNRVGFFDTGSHMTLGLNTNGALSILSIAVGTVLLAAAVRGGNTASTLTMVVGSVFVLAGFVGLFTLDSRYNFLNFRMQNVLFSFAVGLLLMTGGMYGRVSGTLPRDNPYWRSRHEMSRDVRDGSSPRHVSSSDESHRHEQDQRASQFDQPHSSDPQPPARQ